MENGYKLEISPLKGEGIFATKEFQINDIVMVGKIEKRLDHNHSHASQIGENTYVFHAGFISKVNHSCNPNCGIKVNSNDAHDFVAMKNINSGEEITFDYAMRNFGIDYFPKICKCGSDKCRGKITGWKDLSLKKKEEYKGYVAPYLLAMDKKNSLLTKL